MLVVVNFHYVQEAGKYAYPGIHPVTPSELKGQLDELARNFEFISGCDLLTAINRHTDLPNLACLITFDDGLRDHYDNAVPILEASGIPAVFFVSSAPVVERRALTVHKTQWLRATRSPETFWDITLQTAEKLEIPVDWESVTDEAATSHYRYDDLPNSRVKLLLNHKITHDDHRRIIDEIFRHESDEADFCTDYYMNGQQIAEVSRAYTIGSHGHAHLRLARLASKESTDELMCSKNALERICGRAVEIVSYPYGDIEAVSRRVAVEAQDAGYVAGITLERSANQSLDDPMLLARLDTNDAPGGRSPKLQFQGNSCTFESPVTEYRTRYTVEEAS